MNGDCFYCARDQSLDDLMIKVCELKVSTLYLFKEQTYRGRCVVAFNKHVNELFELPEQELTLFMQDVTKAARAIKKTFSADKINYGIYSDKLPHLHFHLVPKYKEGHTWGSTFEMMPSDKLLLSEAEYAAMGDLIKANLRDEA
ncbi:MAG: family hydrolase, diadenosine tetraphosphate hydrolase [Firmicutes bacterium]|nr:family hydrolase, diadenosine tetraphosphate hydrolase [Bacillota bacterium]